VPWTLLTVFGTARQRQTQESKSLFEAETKGNKERVFGVWKVNQFWTRNRRNIIEEELQPAMKVI
jgi:hypothetical protein